jgi:hypothetical protein
VDFVTQTGRSSGRLWGVIAEGLGGNGHEGAAADGSEGDAALGDAEEGVEAGGAAGFGWGMHISDSRLALGRGGFRFSGP